MRSKHILSIAAFIVAFGLSTVLASLFIPIPRVLPVDYTVVSNNKPTSCYLRQKHSTIGDKLAAFIRQDENNGNRYEDSAYNFDWDNPATVADYAASVEEYVAASSSMSANNFPSDFQTAWRKHMKAWRDYSKFLNKTVADLDSDDASWEEFQKMEVFYNGDNGEISRTWKEVLRTGASYGADVR